MFRDLTFASVLTGLSLYPVPARAQQQANGFALERLYQSAPGGGWIVMDSLDMHGEFGGVVELTAGYANNPLVVQAGGQSPPLFLLTHFWISVWPAHTIATGSTQTSPRQYG